MRRFATAALTVLGSLLKGAIRGYQRVISPFLPSACRFHPTCSEYMREAIELHGPVRGTWYGLKRLGRCHPFHSGGFDPVPR
jgi:putative membrane protein insertion efficiency factor